MSEQVHQMFTQIASRYDVTNDVLSMGTHRLWRKTAVKLARAKAGDAVLDCATGTGDLAIDFKRVVGATGSVLGTDFNAAMLSTAPAKAKAAGFEIAFEVADATKLPYSAARFDVASIAFGIRNVPKIEQALKEAYRVLKPGGRFLCLEFSPMDLDLAQKFYDAYSFTVIPAVGKVVTGDGQPYRYLVESIRTFPKQEAFADMISAAGFSRVTWRNLTGGIAAIHSGWRI